MSYWRKKATDALLKIYAANKELSIPELKKLFSKSYSGHQRANEPYKQWLKVSKELLIEIEKGRTFSQ